MKWTCYANYRGHSSAAGFMKAIPCRCGCICYLKAVFLHPPTRCPVCGDTAITVVQYPSAFKGSAKQPTTYRCSRHHTFYALPREVERSRRLRAEAQHIRRARNLQGKMNPNVAMITRRFERIETEEVVKKARDVVRQSRETRANAKHMLDSSKNLLDFSKKVSERAREGVTDVRRKQEQRFAA